MGKIVTLFSSFCVNQFRRDRAQIGGEIILYGMIEFPVDILRNTREIGHGKYEKSALFLCV